jgi:tetrapyrrole methylase family protein/MazG family protein
VGNLIYQVYDRRIASDVKLKLMESYPDEFEVTVIFGGASPGEQAKIIPLYKLDRLDVDHLTSLYVPPFCEDAEDQALSEYPE